MSNTLTDEERGVPDLETPFTPGPVYFEDADALEYVSADVPTIARRVDDSLTVLMDMEDRDRVIGIRLEAPKRAFAQPPAPVSRERVARALFAANFHPDDVMAGLDRVKWDEWPEDQAKAFRGADAVLDLMSPERRPIATAPRDGTHVLLIFGQDGQSEGWWEDNDADQRPWKFIDTGCPGSPFKNGEMINACRDGVYGPSHWLPLLALGLQGEDE